MYFNQIMSIHFQEGTHNDKNILIVSFGGFTFKKKKTPRFEFLRFLNKTIPEHDRLFIVDKNQSFYHKGIEGISTNIYETIEYLQPIVEDYKQVIFIGVSAGGYGAILFGSLLNVDTVMAFTPQTILTEERINVKRYGFKKSDFEMNDNYLDLEPFINNTTNYLLYGDPKIRRPRNIHHLSQCTHIENHENVNIHEIPKLKMKTLRDNGYLKQIVLSAIN